MDSFKRKLVTPTKNLFDIPLTRGYPSNTGSGSDTKRTWTTGAFIIGLNPTNYFSAGSVVSWDITKDTITTSSTGHYGVAIAFELTPSTKYTISCNISGALGRVGVTSYTEDGTASYIYASDYSSTATYTFTVPVSSKWVVFSFIAQPNTGVATFSHIQLEEGSAKTNYITHGYYPSCKSITYTKKADGTLKKVVSYKKKIVTDLPAIQKISERANYPVKSQFTTTRGADALTWDVLDYDKHTLLNSTSGKSMCVGMHDIVAYNIIPFSAPQLMYYTEDGLPAGNYKLTLKNAGYNNNPTYDGEYMFTLTRAIPAGGGFRHIKPLGQYQVTYAKSDIIGNYLRTYNVAPTRNALETAQFLEYDGVTECIDLGVFTAHDKQYYEYYDSINHGYRNSTERQAYGDNRWRYSAIRQWLNSDAPTGTDVNGVSNWWKPQTIFDMPPGNANTAGFLYGLDKSFVASIGAVKVISSLHDIDRIGDEVLDVTYDKVWLQSRTELLGSATNGVNEGTQLAYWIDSYATDRIKSFSGIKRYWWVRSSAPPVASYCYTVSTTGVVATSAVQAQYGIVPTCCIMQY